MSQNNPHDHSSCCGDDRHHGHSHHHGESAEGRADLSGPAESPITVEVTRGSLVESVHRARACIVDAGGHVLARWGDIDAPVYPRSAIKPLQAIPLVESGALDAFGQSYGVTPAAYRKRGRLNPPVPASHQMEDSMHDVEIRDLPAHRIVGLPHTGPYMTIGTSFDRLYAWASKQGLTGLGTRSFAIYYDDPESVKPEELRSFAGLMLDLGVVEDGVIRVVDIPGGRHAVVRHKGPYAELGAVYRWLYGEWLPNSGHTPGDAPCYEEYLNNPRALPPSEWLTEICVPLAG